MGLGVNSQSQNKPFGQWILSKLPAAFGGLVAHYVYHQAVELFPKQAKAYGPDIVGSIGLALGAYVLDHDLIWADGISSDFTQSFTDGMMGRGAPAVLSGTVQIWKMIANGFNAVTTEQANPKPAGALRNEPSIDNAPEVLAEMMSMLRNSPETRQKMAADLIAVMEQQNMRVDDAAKSRLANCIESLANNYSR
ncbi:hypothetical protein BVG81_005265 [Haliangium sp. UPWRP_2]|nr:hypothetical protein BVG81_005265 [Haliangium sp. UPWRP_2]